MVAQEHRARLKNTTMKDRLRVSDYRFIAVCLVLLAATIWFSVGNFYRAFPEASIDFRVNRQDAQQAAGRFLSAEGYQAAGYRQAARFDFDDEAKTFLEREAGLEQANRIMGTRVPLWRWSNRWPVSPPATSWRDRSPRWRPRTTTTPWSCR